MAREFAVSPQSVIVGTATNNVQIQFGYDPSDHSVCKIIVTPTGTLAAATECTFTRNGRNFVQLAAVAAVDQQALGQQAAQGGPADASIVPRGGFAQGAVPF